MCVDNAVLLYGACYYVSTQQTSWFTARMNCLSRGGDLVRIASPAVWSAIKAHLELNYRYLPLRHYWIGLAAMYWYWSNGACLFCGVLLLRPRCSLFFFTIDYCILCF